MMKAWLRNLWAICFYCILYPIIKIILDLVFLILGDVILPVMGWFLVPIGKLVSPKFRKICKELDERKAAKGEPLDYEELCEIYMRHYSP